MTSEVNQLTLRPMQQIGLSQQRRGSFLFRTDTTSDTVELHQHLLPTFPSTKNLVASSANASVSASPTFVDHLYQEDQIVTPFAQILQRLQGARNNYVELTNVTDRRRRRSSNYNSEPTKEKESSNLNLNAATTATTGSGSNNSLPRYSEEFSLEILDDLDWCLDQLEAIQTHRSVGDLATTKFKRILTKELNQLAESSRSGSQISEYISNTFLDKEEEGCQLEAKNATTIATPTPTIITTATFIATTTATTSKATTSTTTRPLATISTATSTSKSLATTPTASFKSVIDTFVVKGVGDEAIDDVRSDEAITSPSKFGVVGADDDAIEQYLGDLNDWNMSVFKLDEITDKRSLTVMAYTIFQRRDLISKFNIPESNLLNYLSSVERHYNPWAPYHNRMHATDVTHAVHVILNKAPLLEVFTDVEILSIIFSSIIHDVDHPGLTNNHLINTNSELALMYNDESVLENHHLAVAFKLLQKGSCDIFCNVPAKTRQRIRKMSIDMVLATDMSKHMSLLADMKTMVETKKVSGAGLQLSENYNERIQVLKCLLHCADLCNPTKNLTIYCTWIERVMEEFFNQGDIERNLGLDISPMCDRHTASIEKSQVGFIDFIVQPLWETWAELVDPHCNDILDEIEINRNYFQLLADTSDTSPFVTGKHNRLNEFKDRLSGPLDKAIFQFGKDGKKRDGWNSEGSDGRVEAVISPVKITISNDSSS